MSRFEEYVKSVFVWNKDLKDFLKSQNVQEHEEIWNKLDRFSEIVEGAAKTLSTEELANLQTETNLLHREMEAYFAERQQLGTVWMTGADIEAGKHILPPLPYRYDALEPVISEEIMRIHHDKHHRSYVDGLNKAEIMLKKARESGDFSLVKHWSRELAFHGSGHYLHTIFWNNMSPAGGGRPQCKLLKEIDKYFGSFEAFQKHFSEAAKQVEGVGWALLVWSPRSRHLEILQSERHNLLTQWDTIPILVLDVWEHAYYLQYQNNRAEYVDNWWEIVNWRNAEDRFEKASQLKWRPY